MIEFISQLFDSQDFPARWHCGQWSDAHGWLHIISDLMIFGAYMTIPVVLATILNQRKDIPFPRTVWLFIAFIGFCGVSHLVEAIIFWQPVYRFSGVLKAGTAIASWATVVGLIPSAKRAIMLRSPKQLETQIAQRTAELSREKARLEAILQSISAGVIVADAEGNFSHRNRAAEQILGLGGVELPTEAWLDNYEWFEMDGKTPCEATELPLEKVLRGPDGSIDEKLIARSLQFADRILQVSARSIRDEEGIVVGGVASFADVTEKHEAEVALAQSNEDLEQFAYAASHDLKEPLRQIQNYSGLLAEQYVDLMDEEGRRRFGYITEGAERLGKLIQGLLDYSRVGTSVSTIVDCSEVVREILLDLELLVQETGADIQVGSLPVVEAPPLHVRQVLQNLMANAIKFRGENKLVVKISATEVAREYQFCVEDNGIGLKKQYSDKIFRIFQRLHTREEYPGTGIGLALCQKIVTSWGGNIWVKSSLGRGSQFFFTIPNPDTSVGSTIAPRLDFS